MMGNNLAKVIVVTLAFTAVATSASAQCPNAGPFCIEGSLPDPNTGAPALDPNGNTKELGPENASDTKIGFIDSAAVPMLDLTNPNASVDLNTVFLANRRDLLNHVWVYFAWLRDSTNGSGFVSLEAQVAASDCAYPITTKDACNPWANRANGDPLFSWDQQGNSHNIYYRVFSQAANGGKGGFITPAVCPGTVEDLGCLLDSAVARAEYNSDFSGGELAIDLTALSQGNPNACTLFANVIPGTVTGNSDTADYKDVVLEPLSIRNCGTVTVKKVTIPAGRTSDFPYTLDGPGDIFPDSADADCTVSGASKASCEGMLHNDGETHTIADVAPSVGNTYTLGEGALQSGWSLVSIVCVANGQTYPGTGFPVSVEGTTACTITNRLTATPVIATVQHAIIWDEATISGLLRDPSETPMTLAVELYNADCTVAIPNSRTTATIPANVTSFTIQSPNVTVPGGTYNWVTFFAGNNFNSGLPGGKTPCGHERTVVTFTYQQQ